MLCTTVSRNCRGPRRILWGRLSSLRRTVQSAFPGEANRQNDSPKSVCGLPLCGAGWQPVTGCEEHIISDTGESLRGRRKRLPYLRRLRRAHG